jgi:hypothetical protein
MRWLLRAAVALAGLGQAWVYRYESNPDGTAYLDLAKAWLRGDWAHALSSYWSPLYSWLLAAAFAAVRPTPENTLPLAHAVNAVGMIACLCGWELLYSEWQAWQGPPAHPVAVQMAGYATLLWMSLHLLGMATLSPDLYVAAIFLGVCALLIRVRRGAAGMGHCVALGALLGLCFLTKAACLVLLPVCLAVSGVLLRSVADRRLWAMAAAALVPMGLFAAALSVTQHRLTFGDTGRLNYSMVVGGYSVEGYKDSVTPMPADLPHRFEVLSESPRVLGFASHVTGTYPPHNDPSWWLSGLPLRMNPALQARSLQAGTLFTLLLFAGCPGLLFLAVCARGTRLTEGRTLWFLLVPCFALLSGYIVIVVHARYIAGPLAVFGFAAIAFVWRERLAPARLRMACAAAAGALLFTTGLDLISIPLLAARQIAPGYSTVTIAEMLRKAGVQAGDKAGYIGNGVFASWAELDGVQIVAIVPVKVFHDDRTIARDFEVRFDEPDRFWASGPEAQERALNAMRDAGARWVFADNLPKGVRPEGWMVAGQQRAWSGSRSDAVYYRRLTSPEPAGSPRPQPGPSVRSPYRSDAGRLARSLP